jgi:Ran GTPase-activating protein (RanGAP) involved in mRNA processing and transport
LKLASNNIGNDGAATLAGMRQLSNLESLDLVGNGISDSGARAIAQSPYLGGLRELRMTRNPIRKKSWTMLELRFGMALM